MQAVGDTEAQADDVGDFDNEAAIRVYQQLITQLPALNRQLLLYILDLLAVFASKSDLNRMTSANLSAIFQPGLLSHPSHDMSPAEYRLSQDVLIFLIENQDHFLIGMTGTAADDKTMREVQAGTPRPSTPTTPLHGRSKSNVARSPSNGSAGAEDVRKYGGIRRNVSVSSKHSRHSNGAPSSTSSPYATPLAATTPTIGVHRSNTVPSKKSPALSAARFNKPSDPPTPTSTGLSPPGAPIASPLSIKTSDETPTTRAQPSQTLDIPTFIATIEQSDPPATVANKSQVSVTGQEGLLPETPPPAARKERKSLTTPNKERNLSSLFSRTPASENEKKDSRSPNKLRKRRTQGGSAAQSPQSSSTSLVGQSGEPSTSPTASTTQTSQPTVAIPVPQDQEELHLDAIATSPPSELSNTQAIPAPEISHQTPLLTQDATATQSQQPTPQQPPGATLKPNLSPTPSNHSHSSMASQSDPDRGEEAVSKVDRKRRSRWRLSQKLPLQLGSDAGSTAVGSNPGAATSSTSIGSSGRPKKNPISDIQLNAVDHAADPTSSVQNSESDAAESSTHAEKRGPLGWLKARINDRKEVKKERAKSPPPSTEGFGLRKSLQISREALFNNRGRSVELMREGETGSGINHDDEKANPSNLG
jgi:GTPase-activating protein SAC7